MPELPEVESIRLSLLPNVLDRIISEVVCTRPELIILRSKELVSFNILSACRITGLKRRGKYLLWFLRYEAELAPAFASSLSNGSVLIMAMHLRMTGRCLYFGEHKCFLALDPHTHITLKLSEIHKTNGHVFLESAGELRWQDVRRFGRWELFTKEDFSVWEKGPNSLGKEPFDSELDPFYLQAFAKKHARLNLAQVLLDQRCIAGLGNIYVQEILFKARLAPQTPAAALTEFEWQGILEVMRPILEEAIREGGTSFSDYLDANGMAGRYQKQLLVYGRAKASCPSCAQPLQKERVAGRTMTFCPACQPLKQGKAQQRV